MTAGARAPSRIRVLVVDDSAFVRKVVTQMLERSPAIEVVAAARDGEEALQLTERLRPDVITLDLVMPRMSGVEFLRAQRTRRPVPVVVCSIAHQTGAMALDALDAGAVDFVQKPTALASDRVFEIADELIAKVQAAARVARLPSRAIPTAASSSAPVTAARAPHTDIVVIGVSTGGPQALRALIPRFAADFPVPISIVLHMPVGYTEMYANRLNEISHLDVCEVADGAILRPGAAWLAPAGQHLSFVRGFDGKVRSHLDLRPEGTQHRPSVDVLFRSAADVFASRVLGVIMTGMGSDGLLGAGHIKARGGRIVTEAESSCVVYGMPRVVVDASLSDRIASLDEMANAIVELL